MAKMNKAYAEKTLELNEAYDYSALRRAYRDMCKQYHPDTCASNGMSQEAASEYMTEINEAHAYLKSYFDDDAQAKIVPECLKAKASAGSASSAKNGASNASTEANAQPSAASAAASASYSDGAGNAYSAAAAAYEQAKQSEKAQKVHEVYEAGRSNGYTAAAAAGATWFKEHKAKKKAERKDKEGRMPMVYKVFSHLPYRILFFCIIVGYTLFTFGGLNVFPNITGIREASGYELVFWYLLMCPLATLNLALPFITTPIRAIVLAIIEAVTGAKKDMFA